jgi:hypothetical protein
VPNETRYKWHEVLLDNQADRSIVHPKLLNNLRPADAVVTGITGDSIPVTEAGDLYGFFECLASDKTGVSVLSFAEVEAKYEITYKRKRCFIVHLPGRDLVFRRKRNMYVANMSDWRGSVSEKSHVNVTVASELERNFTPSEVKRARGAVEFMRNAGAVSERDAVNLLSDGNITGVDLTAQDVRNASKMYGKSTEFYRGKMTQRAVNKTPIDPSLKDYDHVNQVMTSDVMHVGGKQFLLSLLHPLDLLEKLTADALISAFQGQVDTVASRGFRVRVIHMDPQPGHGSYNGSVTGVEFDIQGAGDHSDKIDQKIRRVKELVRSVISGLPWNLPKVLIDDVIFFAVNRLNMRCAQSSSHGVAAPRVKFTGRKPSFKKEFSISFGDYLECYKPGVKSNDALKERSDPCLALYPTGNASGSWVVYNFKTRRRVRRTNWRKMITTQLVINAVNQLLADEENGIEIVAALDDEVPDECDTGPVRQSAKGSPPSAALDTGVLPHHVIEQVNENVYDDMPELVESNSSGDDSGTDDEDEDEDGEPATLVSESDSDDEHDHVQPIARKRSSSRVANGVHKPDRYQAHHMSVKKGMSEYGQAARDAVESELKQLFVDKKAMSPVQRKNLSADQRKRVIRSFMFLKAKFDGMGKFEKIKARLVANGSQQDARPKSETAFPTVAMDSMLMCLSIAAKEGRQLATADIGGAYLNAKMEDEDEVYMELDTLLAEIVRTFLPSVETFIDDHGKLTVKLDKALYGCVQSALLWYQTLTDFLLSLGLTPNKCDKCVWNIDKDGMQLTVMLYVDDLLITCKSKEVIDWFLNEVEREFKDLKTHRSEDLSYLGMHMKWGTANGGRVTVSMAAFIKTMLEESNVTGGATSPADNDIFDLDESALLSDSERKEFHTVVAKLLYVAHRTRPDIMLAVSFLTTRVSKATVLDQKKLTRVLKYLNATADFALVLSGVGDKLEIAIDAAFALHDDGNSHSGALVTLYGDTVLAKSSKQKIVTRDSTEAELVALSDKILLSVRCHEFLLEQGVDIEVPTALQDNTSTISLVTIGGGKYRNKYMRVRQQWVLRMVQDGDIKVLQVGTGQMFADGLTKPLQGNLGRYMASRMLNGNGSA